MAVYGHYRWFRFRKLLETDASGFTWEGRRYAWSDMEEIEQFRRPFWLNLLLLLIGPVGSIANICLRDGDHIRLDGLRLAREGESTRLGVLGGFCGESGAYRELVSLLESKLQQSRTSWRRGECG